MKMKLLSVLEVKKDIFQKKNDVVDIKHSEFPWQLKLSPFMKKQIMDVAHRRALNSDSPNRYNHGEGTVGNDSSNIIAEGALKYMGACPLFSVDEWMKTRPNWIH